MAKKSAKTKAKSKRTAKPKGKGKSAAKATSKAQPARNASAAKASASKKAARKRAARLKAIEASKAAEATAAATIHYAPPPFEATADPSKAPGHTHRHPPMSIPGVKHSEAYIAKARTPFNRRMNIGR